MSKSNPDWSFMAREGKAVIGLAFYDATNAQLMEEVDVTKATFGIVQKTADVDTFIRANWSGNAASGELHWHCKWEPLTDDGFVEPV